MGLSQCNHHHVPSSFTAFSVISHLICCSCPSYSLSSKPQFAFLTFLENGKHMPVGFCLDSPSACCVSYPTSVCLSLINLYSNFYLKRGPSWPKIIISCNLAFPVLHLQNTFMFFQYIFYFLSSVLKCKPLDGRDFCFIFKT